MELEIPYFQTDRQTNTVYPMLFFVTPIASHCHVLRCVCNNHCDLKTCSLWYLTRSPHSLDWKPPWCQKHLQQDWALWQSRFSLTLHPAVLHGGGIWTSQKVVASAVRRATLGVELWVLLRQTTIAQWCLMMAWLATWPLSPSSALMEMEGSRTLFLQRERASTMSLTLKATTWLLTPSRGPKFLFAQTQLPVVRLARWLDAQ